MARFALDGDELSGEEEELLRADNICREKLGFPLRSGAVMQPWVIHEPVPEHKIKLRFTIDSALALDGVSLALEDAEKAQITLNGQAVDNTVTGWFGDILSYSRIMALMLAGSVIATVFNTIGGIANTLWLFIPVFIIGHSLNFALNLLGCYVHDLRLQCLEYFGKFYKDGGRAFKPLEVSTKYYDIAEE